MVGMNAKSWCSHLENPRGNGGKGEMGGEAMGAFRRFSLFSPFSESAAGCLNGRRGRIKS
jgi:hypothetical protein